MGREYNFANMSEEEAKYRVTMKRFLRERGFPSAYINMQETSVLEELVTLAKSGNSNG